MQKLFNIKNETYQKEELNTSQSKTKIVSLNIQYPKNSKNKFLCEKCNKFFSTSGNLRNHISFIHENYRPYKCSFPNCNKAYGVESKLIIHERTHTGLKPFKCQICQKTFNEKGNLKAHLKFHSEIRPYKCPLCNKDYKTKGHLKDHIEIEHNNIKKFCCPYCNKNFGRSSTLKEHIQVHTKEKRFQCKFEGCGKKFTEKRNMEQHYARHFKKLNIKINNVKIKKTYGPRKVEKDFEEKIKVALNQLDDRNAEQKKIEKKRGNRIRIYIGSFDEKDDLIKDCCINNLDSVNDPNLSDYSQCFPLIINTKKNNIEKLNNMTVKNNEKCIKEEKNYDDNDNYFNVNNINNDNNFIGSNYKNFDTFSQDIFSNIDFNNNDLYLKNDLLVLDINNNDLNEHNDFFTSPPLNDSL